MRVSNWTENNALESYNSISITVHVYKEYLDVKNTHIKERLLEHIPQRE